MAMLSRAIGQLVSQGDEWSFRRGRNEPSARVESLSFPKIHWPFPQTFMAFSPLQRGDELLDNPGSESPDHLPVPIVEIDRNRLAASFQDPRFRLVIQEKRQRDFEQIVDLA